jgi:prepilin-type processing-associated H-X9-DG protein
MKTVHHILAVVMFAIIGVTSVARADSATLQDILSGKQVPLALKLKDLDGNWRRVRITASSDTGAFLGMYAQLMGGAGAGVYYTKGDVVVLAGLTYVIAYQHPSKPVDTMALMRGGTPPEPETLTPETPLTLALIQLRTASTLGDIRPFNLDQEIAERAGLQKAVEGAHDGSVNAASVSNLKQIGLGLAMCADDHDGKLPNMSDPQSMKKALTKYITSENVFVHPKTGKPYQPNPSMSGKEWQETNTVDAVLVYEPDPAQDGTRAVLFGDGHVERVNETKWLGLKKTSNIP